MDIEQGREKLEEILVQYKEGEITEEEQNNAIFDILYQVLYPEQF